MKMMWVMPPLLTRLLCPEKVAGSRHLSLLPLREKGSRKKRDRYI